MSSVQTFIYMTLQKHSFRIGALICIGCRNRLLESLVIPVYLIHPARWDRRTDSLSLQHHHLPASDFGQIRNLKNRRDNSVFLGSSEIFQGPVPVYFNCVTVFHTCFSLFFNNSFSNQFWIESELNENVNCFPFSKPW